MAPHAPIAEMSVCMLATLRRRTPYPTLIMTHAMATDMSRFSSLWAPLAATVRENSCARHGQQRRVVQAVSRQGVQGRGTPEAVSCSVVHHSMEPLVGPKAAAPALAVRVCGKAAS